MNRDHNRNHVTNKNEYTYINRQMLDLFSCKDYYMYILIAKIDGVRWIVDRLTRQTQFNALLTRGLMAQAVGPLSVKPEDDADERKKRQAYLFSASFSP